MFITFEFIYCTLMLNFTIELFSLPELLDILLSILEKVEWSEMKGYIDESPHLRFVAPFISIILVELFLIIDPFYKKKLRGKRIKKYVYVSKFVLYLLMHVFFFPYIHKISLHYFYVENGKILEDANNNIFFICINLIQKVFSSS